MATSRPTPQQILTDLALDAAREATWQGFREAGVKEPLIDREKNVVAGTTGDGVLQAARLALATFEEQSMGTLITFESKPIMGGVVEVGGVKRKQGKKLGDAVEKVIERGWTRMPDSLSPFGAERAAPVAPIAAPGAPIGPVVGEPVYGGMLPAKQGTTLIIYGVLGLFCCQILAPFTWYYSNQALKKYGDIDPGDKSTVKVARILGILGCLFLIGRIVVMAANAGGR